MKYNNLRAFEKHLEGSAPSHFSPVYLVVSKEPFIRKKAVERILFHTFKGETSELNLKSLEGESASIAAIESELNHTSLFAEKSALVIYQADKLKKNVSKILESYVSNPNPKMYLILVAPAWAATTNSYKQLEKRGVIVDIPLEKVWEKEKSVAIWIGEYLSSAGKKIAPELCQSLVKQIGTDQSVLEQELEKLLCYLGERLEITRNDLAAICSHLSNETIWQLGEAIFRREPGVALSICKSLLDEGAPLIVLLKQLRHQFQTNFQVYSILAQGGTGQDIAEQFPYMKGIILEKHIQVAQNYGLQRLKSGIIAIDETDLKARNSITEADLLAELLMIKLTI